jgi:Rhodopirellula transposase DDE domain
MSEQKWVRSSLRQLSQRLGDLGHSVSPPTVGRLLRHLGYSLRVNVKKLEASAAHPEREKQFEHIERQKQCFESAHWPSSVSTPRRRS